MFGLCLNIFINGGMMFGVCLNWMDVLIFYILLEIYDKFIVIKGLQMVFWGLGVLVGMIFFECELECFGEFGLWVNVSLLVGFNGCFDKVLDVVVGNWFGYLCFIGNYVQFDDYEDGVGNIVLLCWKKWNGDVVVGWIFDEDILIEFIVGKGDGEVCYVGCGMDGLQFKCESLGLCFVKLNVSDVLEKVEVQVYYNYVDYIMDNFCLCIFDLFSMMFMLMVFQVD